MVEEILRIEVLLRHAAVFLIQEAKVAVDINHRRHHRLAGQIDMHSAAGSLKLAFPADTCEMAVLHDERRIFYWRLTVAQDEPPAIIERNVRWALRLDKGTNDQQEEAASLHVAHRSS